MKSHRFTLKSILLGLALLLSTAILAPPTSAPGVIQSPAGGVVTVNQGEVCLLRHKLYFSKPEAGSFKFVLYWVENASDENLSVENVRCYWENGSPMENIAIKQSFIYVDADPNKPGWQLEVEGRDIWANDTFIADVYLRAGNGAWHKPGDHLLTYAMDIITIVEDKIYFYDASPITVRVLPAPIAGVSLEISPNLKTGVPGTSINFIVKLTNISDVQGSYLLTVQDNSGWGPTISPMELFIPAGESRTATLNVAIPQGVPPGSEDKITVTATSRENSNIRVARTCIVRVLAPELTRGVSLSISPSSKSGAPGETLSFTVSVRNEGNVDDTFSLEISGGSGWSLRIDPAEITLSAGETGEVTLFVTIPTHANEGDTIELTVTATSLADRSLTASQTCRVTVEQARFPIIAAVVLAILAAIATGFALFIIKHREGEKQKRYRVLGGR